MMGTFDCWIQDYGHEREDGLTFDVYGPEEAASAYLERRFADLDYPSEIEVSVAAKDSAEVTIYTVTVEPVPQFHSSIAPQHKYTAGGDRTLCGIGTKPPTGRQSTRPCRDCRAIYERIAATPAPGKEP